MANIKYNSSFYSGRDNYYTFQLHDLAFSGSSTEVKLGAGGFVLNFNSEGDELYKDVVKATDISVDLLVEDSTMESYLIGLIDNAEKSVYITIKKDGVYYWGGVVLTDLIRFNSCSFPYFITLTATDYLGTLNDTPFNSANWRLLSANGTHPVTTFFADILSRSFPTNDYFYLTSNKLFSTCSPLYESAMSSTSNIYEKSLINTRAYTDDNNEFTKTYMQVLVDILTAFGCKLMWSDGMYRIIDDRAHDFADTWEEFFYDYDGTYINKVEVDNRFYMSTYPDTKDVFLVDPVIEYDSAISKTQITLHTSPECRNDLNNPNSVYASNLSSVITTKRDNLVYQLYNGSSFAPNLQGGSGQRLKIRFKVKIDQSVAFKVKWIYVVFKIQSGATIYRLANNATFGNGYNPNLKIPAPYVWAANNVANYVILPYIQGQLEYIIDTPALPLANQFINSDLYIIAGGGIDATCRCVNEYLSNKIYLKGYGIKVGLRVMGTGIPNGTTITSYLTTNTWQLSNANTYIFGALSCDIEDPDNDIISTDEAKISFDLMQIGYINTALGDIDNEGVIYNSTNNSQRTKFYDLDSVYIGDQIAIANKSSIQIINSSNLQQYSDGWKLKPTYAADTSRKLLLKLTEQVVGRLFQPLKKYSATLLSKEYLPHNVLVYKDELLIFVGGNYTADMDELRGEWYVLQKSSNLNVGSKSTGVKDYAKDIAKNTYPLSDVAIFDKSNKELFELVGNITTVVQVMKPIINDVEQALFDYQAFDPQFKIQVTGATITATSYKEDDTFMTAENGKFWKVINGTITQTFQAAAAGSGITTIGTIDSQTKSSNGLVISGSNLVAQTADATNVGMVSIGTQTFAGAKTFNNGALSSVVITSSNYSAGSGSHISITPNITANANNATINAVSINPTLSAGAFTGVTLVDLALTRNNPNINIGSGNLAFMSAQTTQMVIRSASGGVTMLKSKIGSVTGAATNVLDVGGDSLFSAAASTPATASARVHIVGSGTSSGTALLVTNSTPTTIIKADNNQDLYLGSSGGKVGFFAVTPIVRPTTAGAAATYVSGGGGTNIKTDDTFDGYSLQQVVRALKNLGLLT